MSDQPVKYEPVSTTVKQVGDVTGIDRMDSQDRAKKLSARTKLELLCEESRAQLGRDPRGDLSGLTIVGRPRVVLQVLLDLIADGGFDDVRLERGVVLGAAGGDVVGWWRGAKIVVRCRVRDDKLYAMSDEQIPDSDMLDRRRAAEIRMNAHRGTLERLREVGSAS